MARIRTIKPEFWHDEKLAGVSRDARLLFIGLWNFADDNGRLGGSARVIRGLLFPFDDDIDISHCLDELQNVGVVFRYQAEGKDFFQVRNFSKHQRIDKRAKSWIPPPSEEFSAESRQVRAESAHKTAEPAHEPAESRQVRASDLSLNLGSQSQSQPTTLVAAEKNAESTDKPKRSKKPKGEEFELTGESTPKEKAKSEGEAFYDWCAKTRKDSFPGSISEKPPDTPHLNAWFKNAVSECPMGLSQLEDTWVGYLHDDWAKALKGGPALFKVFMSDKVWRTRVPNQSQASPNLDSPKCELCFGNSGTFNVWDHWLCYDCISRDELRSLSSEPVTAEFITEKKRQVA